MLEELTGRPSTARADGWRAGLVMLRYDAAVFVARRDGRERSCRRGERPFRVAHLTTVDSTLWYLLRPQLLAVLDARRRGRRRSARRDRGSPALEGDGVRHVAAARRRPAGADLRGRRAGRPRPLADPARRRRVDVLHTHNPKPGIYGRVVGRLAGVPIVVNTNHGLYLGDGSRVQRLRPCSRSRASPPASPTSSWSRTPRTWPC